MSSYGSFGRSSGERGATEPFVVAALLSVVGIGVDALVSIPVISVPALLLLSSAPGYLYPHTSTWYLSLAAAAPQMARVSLGLLERPALILAMPAIYLVTVGMIGVGRWISRALSDAEA